MLLARARFDQTDPEVTSKGKREAKSGQTAEGGQRPHLLCILHQKEGNHIKQAEGPLLGEAKFRQTGGDANGSKGPTMGGCRPPPILLCEGDRGPGWGWVQAVGKGGVLRDPTAPARGKMASL